MPAPPLLRQLRHTVLLAALLPSLAGAQTLDEARALAANGDTEGAIEAFRTIATRDATRRPEDAALANNNACVLLTNVGRYEEAQPQCEAALALRQRFGTEDRGLARTMNNLGLVQQYLGRFEAGERQFRGAMALNRRLGEVEGEAVNWANLGLLLTSQGRPREALSALRQGQAVTSRHRDEPWAGEQLRILQINEGALLDRLAAYQEALAVFRKVLEERDELDPALLGALQLNVGSSYAGLGDLWRAEEAFQSALGLFDEVGDVAALSHVWLNLGLLREVHRPEPDESERRIRRALELARDSGDRAEEIQDLFFLGRLLIDRGRFAAAEEAFAGCRRLADASDSREGQRLYLEGFGRLELARNQPALAVPHLLAALDRVERVRRTLDRGSFRDRFFGDQRELFGIAIGALAELDQREPGGDWGAAALSVAQRAKSRDLLDRLGEWGEPGEPLSAVEISRRLADDELLVEHFVTDEMIFLWQVDRHAVRLLTPRPAARILKEIEAIRGALLAGRTPDPRRLRDLAAAVLPLDANGTRPARLRVSPDGALHDLPFELLLEGPSPPSVTYLPSGSALARHGRRDSAGSDLLLAGFAPTFAALDDSHAGLAPLPETAGEVQRVARQLAGRSALFIGRAATEESYRRITAEQPRILHFATHTLLDDRPLQGPAILLSAAGADDGELHVTEVAGQPLVGPLVVLATCGSAQGTREGGRALANLSGAFLAAGASAVLATLWEVGDQAAAAFMSRFYFELSRGVAPEDALVNAKLAFRTDRRWSEPVYWAPYILIGDGSQAVLPVPLARRPWSWALATAPLAGALLLLLWSRRRRAPPLQP